MKIETESLKNENFDLQKTLKDVLVKLCEENNLLDEKIEIKPININLDTKNVKDYPLLNGKEFLLRAFFKNSVGDAFTTLENLSEFNGSISEVIDSNDNQRILATFNAIMEYLKKTDKTKHCEGSDPEKCAEELAKHILKTNDQENLKIGIIGYHPAIIKQMVKTFGAENVLNTDMDINNIGRMKNGIFVMHADMNEYLIENSDIILATGSTTANGTIIGLINLAEKNNKKIIFYGTTVAGFAKLYPIERFCAYGSE
ncbi:Rossmann-like domain-containing protein [Methanococcus voltae]|uniref:Putative heavy-metal chelation domain-containing protein n=1 Tax=Methanococcus voltae (strain ATCC BAA-1334 / A3) TaxID=456320 RepID=D7DTE6_METV3|nr:DUF364 domain-containing protein [Methanococcus voltae]MCS3901258.1 uncharacterized protein (DUF4213/DUF364 family) [Methanococcus voltae]